MKTAYECWDMAGRDPSIPIVIDDTGVGGGVSDRLRELGAKVVAVNFGSSPTDKDKFTSIADELWFNFPIDEVDIPDDRILMAELSGRQYDYDSKGRRKIESKNDYKKRCGKSPDCFIAGTMVLTDKGNRPIETICIGDRIITPLGIEKVLKVWESNTEKLATVRFSNGVELTGKPKHKIYTKSGFIPIDRLQGDGVHSFSYRRIIVWLILKMLFTKARSISFKQLVDTISQERQFQERDLFIGESGLNNMVKYPKDRTFTILMEIGVIMKLGIYRLFHVVNTYLTTLKNGIKILFTELRLMLVGRRQYSKHQNGIGRKLEGHGIHNTEKTHGKAERKSCKPVLFAVNTLKQVSSAQNTVPQHAQINILGITAKRLNLFVNIVVKSLWRKVLMLRKRTVVAVHVEQSCVGPTKTYNLTLEKHNVYFANNILVENCADALLLAYFSGTGTSFPDEIRDAMRQRRVI